MGRPLIEEGRSVRRVLLIILCFFLPFLAVLLHGGGMKKALIALLLQLFGHVPGVIYGIVQVTRD